MIRKRSSMSSLGFSGGVEFTPDAFVQHLSLDQPTNILLVDKSAVVRQDLKWYKPIVIHSRSEYKKPTNFTAIVFWTFLALMGGNFLLLGIKHRSMRAEERILQSRELRRKLKQEKIVEEHEKWKQNIIQQEQELEKEKQKNENTSKIHHQKVVNALGE